jgi:hypothetical protein
VGKGGRGGGGGRAHLDEHIDRVVGDEAREQSPWIESESNIDIDHEERDLIGDHWRGQTMRILHE